jgi:hypothetical protein
MFVALLQIHSGLAQCSGSNCNDCLASSNSSTACGWCQTDLRTSFCADATQGSQCQGENEMWFVGACPDICNSQGDCRQCSQNFGDGCGFCMTTNECQSSSKAASCTDWRDNPNDPNVCSSIVSCESTAFCGDCLSNQQGCIWCGGLSGYCMTAVGSAVNCTGGATPIKDLNSCPSFDSGSGYRLRPFFFLI